MPVELTTAARSDPVFGTLPKEILTFQWHADTFDLPEGATLLARSPGCPHQAFRWGRYAYGLQFHQEVSAEMAEEWGRVPTYRASLESATGADSLPRLVEGIGRHQEGLNRMARAMFGRWLELTSALSDL